MPARPSGGSLAVLAPVRDARSQVAGALLLVDSRTAPPLLPTMPVAAGLLALFVLLLAAASHAERPHPARALLLYLGPLAFFAWLLAGVPVAPGGDGYRYWTVALGVAWVALATLGLVQLRRRTAQPEASR